MKIDQLMDAIEEIDDRYIEESAYGVRRKRNIPWGMIITAACFCMVIGAAMFMQSLGILPHLNGPGATTVQPTTTEPSDTTEPTDPTYILSEATVRNKLTMLFQDKNSWYYRALIDTFESPARLHLRYYFYNSREFGEGLQPTKEEMDELMAWEDYEEGKTLTILPVSKMDAVLTEVFDITVAEMESTAFAGMKYVKSIDSWCFWGLGTMEVNNNMLWFEVVKTTNDENAYRVRVERQYSTSHDVYIQVRENHFYIVYNRFLETHAPPVVPPETTAPSSPTIPPESDPGVEEFFSDRENWQNLLILPAFADPTQFDLRPTYLRAMDGENTYATDLEHEKLASVIPGYSRDKLFRATKAQLDTVMLTMFNITTDQLVSDWEDNFTYLEETGCYYARLGNSRGYTVYIGRTEECDDGTILMYYALARGEEPYMVAKLQPNETGYYILSNERYVDNTGKNEDQIAMEELFKAPGWYNQGLTCEYDSPEQLDIYNFFYLGFKEESKITDEEWEQLKNMQGLGSPAGDIYRLHPDKMNAVLTDCFGITLENVDPVGFNGLAYLESTNCYYFRASGINFIENFKADRVERNADGTIDVYYSISYKGDYVVTVKPHGDSYQILSNQCINSTSTIPPIQTEPTGDTELEKLFFNRSEMPEKESSQKMVDAFLADPDTFVQLLAKQTNYYGVLGVLSRNVTDHHPQIGEYRATVSSMLAKELPEKETIILYGMAGFSGLSNYIPEKPSAEDYQLIMNVIEYYNYLGESAELLRKFSIEDTEGLVAAIAPDQNRILYIAHITSSASQEELKQIKESMKQLIEELSELDGEGIQAQIDCARQVVKSCDENIK